ncbi:MAG TPA: hypothetical protein VGB84_05550 [Arachidicoccus sp.]
MDRADSTKFSADITTLSGYEPNIGTEQMLTADYNGKEATFMVYGTIPPS